MTSKRTIPRKKPSAPLSDEWTPSELQERGIKFLLQHAPGAGLFLDPGAGKTSVVLAALKLLKKRQTSKGALIIAPRRVARMVWTGANSEATKWRNFRELSVGLLHGSRKDAVVHEQHDLYVMTPEGLEWLLFGKGSTADDEMPLALRRRPEQTPWSVLRSKVDVLVVDETSKFKHVKSKRTTLLRSLLKHFKRRWGLTGSPAPNGLLDLYGQVYVLDMGKALGAYFSFYRNAHFEPFGYENKRWRLVKGEDKNIYRKLGKTVMRLEAGDYARMPALMERFLWVELPERAREVYDYLEATSMLELEGNVVAAWSAAGVGTRLKQMANGAVYVEEADQKKRGPREFIPVHDEKLQAVEELVAELQGAPLLIGVEYRHDVQRLRSVLGKDVPYMGGGMTDREAEQVCAKWNAGALPVLLGHPASMGHGLNLQGAAQHVAFFSIPVDYDLYDQFIRRVRRQGNKFQRVFVHHIVARNTVDEDALHGLRRKERTQTALLDAVAAATRKRLKLPAR